jgi:hypothetical protein
VKCQAKYPLCADCGEFDKESWNFGSSNLCRCKVSGRLRWVGTPASDCLDFTARFESVFEFIPF